MTDSIMRYYTHEWATGGLTDEEWHQRDDAYRQTLESLLPGLPPSVVNLEHGEPFGGFHDARLIEVLEGDDLVLRLVTGDLQRGYWDVAVRFTDARVRTRGGTLTDLVTDSSSASLTELLYFEIDRDGSDFLWRVLAWEAIEFEVRFADVELSCAPRDSR